MTIKKTKSSSSSHNMLKASMALLFGLVWGFAPTALGADDSIIDEYAATGDADGGTVLIDANGALQNGTSGWVDTGGGSGSNYHELSGKSGAGIYGGATVTGGDATGNRVTIQGAFSNIGANTNLSSNPYKGNIAAGYSGAGNAINNHVQINANIEIHGRVYGGWAALLVENNSIRLENVVVGDTGNGNGDPKTSSVYGGYSVTGATDDNHVTITGAASSVTGYVAGSWSESNDATNSSVTITNGTVEDGNIYGSFSGGVGTTVSNNTVTLTSTTISEAMAPGFLVHIPLHIILPGSNGGTIVAGGLVADDTGAGGASGDVSTNRVVMTGGSSDGAIFGAFTEVGDASANTVELTGAKVKYGAIGGLTGSGDAIKKNSVVVTGGTIGEFTNGLLANNNPRDHIGGGFVIGGVSVEGAALNNSATVTNATVYGSIFGGGTFQLGDAKNNTAIMTGGKLLVNNAGRGGNIYGGFAETGDAENNTVIISGGAELTHIYGGYATNWNSTPGTEATASANANTITIGGDGKEVKIDGTIHGGFIQEDHIVNGVTKTQGNTITILNRVAFNQNSEMWGGNVEATGNTLRTKNASNMRLDSIGNFDKYEFFMNESHLGNTVYTVANDVFLSGANGVTASVDVNFDVENTLFATGDTVQLFSRTDETDATLAQAIKDGRYTYTANGVLFNYEGMYYLPGGQGSSLNFGIANRTNNDDNISFGQAQLAGLQMANIASDFARDIARMHSIAEKVANCTPLRSGPTLFAGFSGGTSKWNTDGDSRTNLKHTGLVAGLGWRAGSLLLAGYFEGGWGKYDAKVHGRKIVDDEKSDYIGGGFLARYETGNFYAEGGFHAGRLKTDFDGRFNINNTTQRIKYDTSTAYYGIDVLAGYKMEMGCSTFDFSGRYSWNRVNSDDFMIQGFQANQDAATSHRVRGGAEWSYNMGAFKPYAGAYYEYEFDAKSSHSVRAANGRTAKLLQASMKGSSGIGELGVRFGGGENRFSADVGVEGYVGKRRGVTGKALVGFSF